MYERGDLTRILAREELSFEDVKIIMRRVRYEWGLPLDERVVECANALLSHAHARDYLPPAVLTGLVRAEITTEDAATYLDRNKAFFSRLTTLLPALVRFFGEEARSRNLEGLISCIDDCHGDFHVVAASLRKDRQVREAKERLANTSKLANELYTALADPKIFDDGIYQTYTRIEFDRYAEAYCSARAGSSQTPRTPESSICVSNILRDLRVCAGVLEILNATVQIRPDRLFVSSNDARTTVVEYAHRMCTMWNGPKLVTTPGSDFSALCSLLYEAASGRQDEGLAGAINRYARSDDRRRWDEEWDRECADRDENDNFAHQKSVSTEGIEVCKALLGDGSLSPMANVLLRMRIDHEQQKYDAARSAYGPHQILYDGQVTAEKLDEVNRWISLMAEFDILLGRIRRDRVIDV